MGRKGRKNDTKMDPESLSDSDSGKVNTMHSRADNSPATVTNKKRAYYQVDDDDDDENDSTVAGSGGDAEVTIGTEMQKMLDLFGCDMNKAMQQKRKRLELFTQNFTKGSSKKLEEKWKTQQAERSEYHSQFTKQVEQVLQQLDQDLSKVEDQEEKLQKMLVQQQKLAHQQRKLHKQRLTNIRSLLDDYVKGIQDLNKSHQAQLTDMQQELKKEVNSLQKKILMDRQQQEMLNVKKSLQTMLF